jgi:hypothetical protein
MNRLIKMIFWTFLFLIMMLAIDQFLVQVPPVNPAHAAIRNFYRDFRSRMIDLVFGEEKTEPASIEAVIDEQGKTRKAALPASAKDTEQSKPAAKPQAQAHRRYIYSDARGELQFADSLEEVPKAFRGQAQPMGE